MTFEPVSENHSIAEVALALQFSTGFNSEDMQDIVESRKEWGSFLPRMLQSEVVKPTPVNLGANMWQQNEPAPPVSFVRYLTDGRIEWELSILFDTISMRCCFYSRWETVWQTTRENFKKIFSALSNKERSINSAALQYTDIFKWSGNNDDYDVRMLLNEESEFIPPTILKNGPVWHSHQGWFTSVESPVSGRVLTRIHIDALLENIGYIVRFENLERFDLHTGPSGLSLNDIFTHDNNSVDKIFDYLHDTNKSTLSEILHVEIQKRIGLTDGF